MNSQTIPQPTAPTMPRLAYVDTLRAIACLWVVFYHAFILWTGSKLVLRSPVANLVLHAGDMGVDLFLVLSGFCLALPLFRKQDERNVRIDYRVWMTRRCWRILPPYYAALAIFGLALLVPALRSTMNAPAHFYDWPLHVLMAHNLTAGSAVSIVGSFWSLALEFQLYLLFPLFLLLVRKSGLRGALLVTIAVSLAWSVVCLCRVGPHPAAFGTTVAWYYAVPGRAVEFTFGIAAAACISRPRQAQTRISIVLSIVFILATLLLYTGFADQSSLAHSFIGSVHLSLWGLKSVFAGVGFAALLVALQPFDERIHRSKLLGPLTAFGTISFSAYLLQEPLLRYTAPTLTRFQGAGALTEPRFWLITVLWILLILVPLTRMYHIFAERPFLRGAPKWLKLPKKVESVTASIPS